MSQGIGHLYADNGDTTIPKGPGVGVVHIDNMPEGGSSGVTSINGETGDVNLDAEDVGALPANTPIPSTLGDIQTTAGITDIQRVTAMPAEPVSTVLYIVVGS